MEEKRKTILRSLEDDLAFVSEQTTRFEARFTAATKIQDQLKSGIDHSTLQSRTISVKVNRQMVLKLSFPYQIMAL